MAGIVTKKFRLYNAEQFYEAFDETSPSNMYFFIARSLPWSNEQSPPSVNDIVQTTDYRVWDDIMAFKKVAPASVSYVTKRVDWASDTAYAKFDDTSATMNANNFFVFTDDYNVYKCLDNNKNVVSTVKPTGTSNSAITTSDGYVWKYMYTVSAPKALSFLTSTYIPVQTLTSDDGSMQWDVQESAANGSIETCHVVAGGSSYVGVTGTAQAGAAGTITLAAGASAVNNYYANSSIYLSGGTGAGQLRRIAEYNGTTKVATVSSNWSVNPNSSSTYIIGPQVVVSGDGTGFSAYSLVSGGALSQVIPVTKGVNYSYANVSIVANAGSGATARAILSPITGHGKDAVKELSGHNVMLNIKFVGSESGTFTTNNDFRTIGLIVDPKLTTGNTATGSVYDNTTRFTVGSLSGSFVRDEIITGQSSAAKGYVVDFQNGTTLRLIVSSGTFSNGENISGGTSSATGTITNITKSLLKKYSGSILYIENRPPISRSADSTEDLRVVIQY